MDNDFERLLSQSVDILIYDCNNKYQLLKNQNIDKDKINFIMKEYQNIRIKEFIDTYKTIKRYCN
jgi:hypothetical protein